MKSPQTINLMAAKTDFDKNKVIEDAYVKLRTDIIDAQNTDAILSAIAVIDAALDAMKLPTVIKVITDGYNVDPTGVVDSTAALQSAINDAFNVTVAGQTIRGLDIRNTVLNLEGGYYKISDELVLPDGAKVKIVDGTISASSTFTTGEYLIKNTGAIVGTEVKYCTLVNSDISIENVLLLCNQKANGVKMIGCDNFTFENSNCKGFVDYGVYAWGDGGIHGFRALNANITQYDWEEVWNNTTRLVTPSGVGIYAGVYDSDITGCSIYLCGTGIQAARSSINLINTHPWGCNDLIVVEPELGVDSVIRGFFVDGIYLDCGGNPDYGVSALTIKGVMQDSRIIGCRFSRPKTPNITMSTDFAFIKLDISDTAGEAAGGRCDRVIITENVFDSDKDGDAGLWISSSYDNAGVGNDFRGNKFESTVTPFGLGVKTVTTTYQITDEDDTIICNNDTTAFTVTLPPANVGHIKQIKNIGLAVVTIEGSGTDTIDNELNQTIHQWDCLVVQCYVDNKWVII